MSAECGSSSGAAYSCKSRFKAWSQFILAIAGIWFIIWVFTPFWVSHSKIHQEFGEAIEDLNVPVGAMYYNDLPFINDAAMILRDTWRFLPRDMSDKSRVQTSEHTAK